LYYTVFDPQTKKGGLVYQDTEHEILPMEYDDIRLVKKEFISLKKGGKYGVMDYKSRKMIIPIIYDDIVENIDLNKPFVVKKNGKYGFIDAKGNEIIACIYEEKPSEFSEGIAIIRKDNKEGLIDKTGKVVVPIIYDDLYSEREGLRLAKKNNKFGFIDRKGTVIIPFIYDKADFFSEGLAIVGIKEENGSSIESKASSKESGRSISASIIFMDECGFIEWAEKIWAALAPTISTGGKICLISTVNGIGNFYHRMWTQAEAGENSRDSWEKKI
jgi:uncharacterized protein involved in tellurium resistance